MSRTHNGLSKPLRANHRTAPELIRDRKDFRNSTGNLRGETRDGMKYSGSGWLSGKDKAVFEEDRPFIKYVVFSFDTPIAWWTGTVRGWYVAEATFSPITSTKHQSRLYLIPRRMPVAGWDCETEALALSDCKHWDKPGTECAGPRVGRDEDGRLGFDCPAGPGGHVPAAAVTKATPGRIEWERAVLQHVLEHAPANRPDGDVTPDWIGVLATAMIATRDGAA